MVYRRLLIHRGFLCSLLAVGVEVMPIANQYRLLADYSGKAECRPVVASTGRLPGCRALPNEKNLSEALEQSSRDPKHGGMPATSVVMPMIAASFRPHGQREYLPLKTASCTDQKIHWHLVRLLI